MTRRSAAPSGAAPDQHPGWPEGLVVTQRRRLVKRAVELGVAVATSWPGITNGGVPPVVTTDDPLGVTPGCTTADEDG